MNDYRCSECKYFDWTDHCTIGYKCTNKDKHFRTKTSCWKHTSTYACKSFELNKKEKKQ